MPTKGTQTLNFTQIPPAMAAATGKDRVTATVIVQQIPKTVTARELLAFLESAIGENTVYACEIFTEKQGWKSRGHGKVQFETLDAKVRSLALSQERKLLFMGSHLRLSHSIDEVIHRPLGPSLRIENAVLRVGFLVKEDCMRVLEMWEGVRFWVMPERQAVEFWLSHGDKCFKLELQYGDVMESFQCDLQNAEDSSSAVLLKLKHAPKLHIKVSAPGVYSRFSADRYHICKEDFNFTWVRTTDFSSVKSIGLLSSLCVEFKGEGLNLFTNLPYYKGKLIKLTLEEAKFSIESDLVPLVKSHPDLNIPYETLFQLNSLIHTQKLTLEAVDANLMKELSTYPMDVSSLILQKLHKLPSTCYDPMSFITNMAHSMRENGVATQPSSSHKKNNTMTCHRILVTPSKIYCLGPEQETSNYVVKNFAEHASDFVRVTFVDEDMGRLHVGTVSTDLDRGLFAKSYRTNIYYRILSILEDGVLIGKKRFRFLAFSASQLRSNSVWMFASNDKLKAEEIRDWMGTFSEIKSVSKCAARMGQLFSTSSQTFEVPAQHVEIIDDIEVTTNDGDTYCFSDGIGKISQSFARQVAQKCGANHAPSAFQIRYGGYKGVLAVDRNSFRKISLRKSMRKFESNNRMLNVTKWNEAMPCFLNREIVTLLSTLGVKDQSFLDLQNKQLQRLDKMLTNREDAVNTLASMGMNENKSIVVRMLLHGYEPQVEPYLSMILQSHREAQLSELRNRCRLYVPRGRILLGCLDETGILEYGQIYVRITMRKDELLHGDSNFIPGNDGTATVKGKVVVTKNPCLHPGDVRILEAVYDLSLEEKGLVDCVLFPQKGERPHPSECSGGDLDGDQYFVSWDESIIPSITVPPMDYIDRRKRLVDHCVTLPEIQKFFVDYMISDSLGAISNAHLVHADKEPLKALSPKCLQLSELHSMAVDFAKTGSPAVMPVSLKPKEFPDFMERWEKPMYTSEGALGVLYRATVASTVAKESTFSFSAKMVEDAYDHELVADGYQAFLETAETHKAMYKEKMVALLTYYGAKFEDEILTGNLHHKSAYLQRDNRRYSELRERILASAKSLHREAKELFDGGCAEAEKERLASAWYHVTYHPSHCQESEHCLGFPWIVGDTLLSIKSTRKAKVSSPVHSVVEDS